MRRGRARRGEEDTAEEREEGRRGGRGQRLVAEGEERGAPLSCAAGEWAAAVPHGAPSPAINKAVAELDSVTAARNHWADPVKTFRPKDGPFCRKSGVNTLISIQGRFS
ncbi:hypothetical protein GUJ93_ZPchr0010g9519 [Zizania palustris]|uniref:Uncharacterized protein n=1 Tax=Zizania palustris TaxID=103762 RepID=A0A8J5WE01_ZIZPA|nr:hypothetical protein GUJ93_ZPchr0010g9519 [Zizania palustris]